MTVDPLSVLGSLADVLTPVNLAYMVLGLAIGTILGAIPGLTGPTGMVLALPLTYFMDPVTALLFLLSIYFSGLFGGAITAVLFATPGNPAAIATVFDGYPLAKKGRPSYALGLAVSASTLGGLCGLILLVFLLSTLAAVAVQFASAELFILALMGVAALASLGGRSFFLSLFAGVTGLMLGTIGIHVSGAVRGTFRLPQLLDGIPLVPALMGLFAVAEMAYLLSAPAAATRIEDMRISLRETLAGVWDTVARFGITLLRASGIGVVIGLIPGMGGPVASILAYAQARRSSKNRERFGQGEPEGVVAAESADNATEGGALALSLVLGIPGSVGTAVILAAITLQGFLIGPRLLIEQPEVFSQTLAGALVAELLLLPVGILVCYPFAYLRRLSSEVLVVVVITISVLGAYLAENSLFTAQAVMVIGAGGWLMRIVGIPLVPLAVGLILGPVLDANYTRLLQGYPEGPLAVFSRPISTGLVILLVAVLAYPWIRQAFRRPRAARLTTPEGEEV